MTTQKKQDITWLVVMVGAAIGVSVAVSWTLVTAHAGVGSHPAAVTTHMYERDLDRMYKRLDRIEAKLDAVNAKLAAAPQ